MQNTTRIQNIVEQQFKWSKASLSHKHTSSHANMSDVGCDVADTASDDSAERGNEEEEKEERGRVGGREVAAGRVWRRGNSKDKNSRG
jgi:hypothetical protein